MRLLVVAGLCAALGFPDPAFADSVRVLGFGVNQTCGAWLSARAQNGVDAWLFQQWALGYLSGAAIFSANYNPLRGVDADGVWYWLDKYCREHPLDSVSDIALKAFISEHPR